MSFGELLHRNTMGKLKNLQQWRCFTLEEDDNDGASLILLLLMKMKKRKVGSSVTSPSQKTKSPKERKSGERAHFKTEEEEEEKKKHKSSTCYSDGPNQQPARPATRLGHMAPIGATPPFGWTDRIKPRGSIWLGSARPMAARRVSHAGNARALPLRVCHVARGRPAVA